MADGAPTSMLALMGVAAIVLGLRAPLYYLFLAGFLVVAFPYDYEWHVAGIQFDPLDVTFGGLAFGMLARPRERQAMLQRPIPYRGTWVALMVLVSFAYLVAPVNADYLGNPIGVVYQLYRYCWRPLLYYALTFMLLDDREKYERALIAAILGGALCALEAIPQGLGGYDAVGPYRTKNALAGALVMPFLLSLSGLLREKRRYPWLCYAAAAAVLARGLLLANSRGAWAAVFAAVGFTLAWLYLSGHARALALRVTLVGLALLIAIPIAKPDILERPTIKSMLSVSKGTEDENMQWRMQTRWPYFIRKAQDNFWFGVGTDVDTGVATEMSTPHNAFLAMAVTSGVPSVILFLVLVVRGARRGFRLFRRGRDEWQRLVGLSVCACIIALFVHSMVDQTLRMIFAQSVMWILVAGGIAIARKPDMFLAIPAPAPTNATDVVASPSGLETVTAR